MRLSVEYCGMLEESEETLFARMSERSEGSWAGKEELHKEEGWYVLCS